MAENWVKVEYGPNIIDSEVDESIELLENIIFFDNTLIDYKDDPEDIILIYQNVPVLSFLYAESSVYVLRNYYEGLKVPTETRFLLDRFA